MPRKAPTSRNPGADEAEPSPRPAKSPAEPKLRGADDLARLALKACLIARDAAFNVRDLLTNSSRMAFLAIKDCEQELDRRTAAKLYTCPRLLPLLSKLLRLFDLRYSSSSPRGCFQDRVTFYWAGEVGRQSSFAQ